MMDRRKLLTGLAAMVAGAALPLPTFAKPVAVAVKDAAWASGGGMLDAGIVNATYHLFMIRNAAGLTDMVVSTSKRRPTLPAGYRIVPSTFGGLTVGSFKGPKR